MTDLYTVKVMAQSPKRSVEVRPDGSLVVRVHAARDKGKANEAVRGVLSEHFSVPLRCVEIVRGLTSSQKTIRILEP